MNKKFAATIAVILLGGAAFYLGSTLGSPDLGSGPAVIEAGPVNLEECPHTWLWTPTMAKDNIEDFTGGRDDVPEYNDCQRFLKKVTSGREYTARAFAIFISDSVATAKTGGVSAADAPVAMVYAGEAYDPLGLNEKGFFCILLSTRGAGSGSWTAKMAPAGEHADCGNPDVANARSLFVFSVGNMGDSIPGVARWGYDGVPGQGLGRAAREVQYAILPCGDKTCYVGPTASNGAGAGFSPKPPQAILTAISPGLPTSGRVRRIDGWHDTQFLASPTASLGTAPTPATKDLVGMLIPDPELADRTMADFKKDWVKVADVAMSTSSGYESKLNFYSTKTGSKYNEIWACYYEDDGTGGTGNCSGLPSPTSLTCPNDIGKDRWRSRHVNAVTMDTTYYCVELTPMNDPGLVLPGTTRWKWLANDETTWFRCPGGCCKEAP